MKPSLNNFYIVDNKAMGFHESINFMLNDRLELLDHLIDSCDLSSELESLHVQRDHIINLICVSEGKTEERKLSDGCFTVIKS